MLGSLILYLMGMRITMFQLSGFYCKDRQTEQRLGRHPHAVGTEGADQKPPLGEWVFRV